MPSRSKQPGPHRRSGKDPAPAGKPEVADGNAPSKSGAPASGPGAGTAHTPFDLWLDRGLHTLFDDITREPVPEALLKIIEQDRNKR